MIDRGLCQIADNTVLTKYRPRLYIYKLPVLEGLKSANNENQRALAYLRTTNLCTFYSRVIYKNVFSPTMITNQTLLQSINYRQKYYMYYPNILWALVAKWCVFQYMLCKRTHQKSCKGAFLQHIQKYAHELCTFMYVAKCIVKWTSKTLMK